ncbi:tetratricopeptide repeat protein [Mastigocoleus testarum]|uniref:Uncharacterized protein n=1 Tax=Mastigocoleus testarum BC008 TaxID=371196 RepID=A0A0V7ZIE4_9CYAN|nr:tetratricopeptide repeat protein [Mastigocoleus testarum]KST63858.1 hypothetical protein BC008_15480 [Mastigocoleus testarum BC008]KST64193.1 hypothetical protein BC008_16255 [Mastigocoleus testarum BC008]
MKVLKVIPAIVLLGFMVVSQKANSQTLPKIELKLKPQIEKLQVDPIQTPDSREDKQTAQIYLKKGLELFKAEKFNEAIQAFGEVIKIQPNNQYAYLFSGLSYFQLKQYQ